jgi:hypothetical protein
MVKEGRTEEKITPGRGRTGEEDGVEGGNRLT